MPPRTPVWKVVLALVVLVTGIAASVWLIRFADADDSPGGMVIGYLLFIAAVFLATKLVYRRPSELS